MTTYQKEIKDEEDLKELSLLLERLLPEEQMGFLKVNVIVEITTKKKQLVDA
jgi:hypothetical protein